METLVAEWSKLKRRGGTRRLAGALLAALLLPGAAPEPEQAWPGRLTWTAYLHAGPGRQYAVLDELDTATEVSVLVCKAGWCRVLYGGAAGYLPQDLLAPAASAMQPVTATPASPACFEARRDGYGQGPVFSYCPK